MVHVSACWLGPSLSSQRRWRCYRQGGVHHRIHCTKCEEESKALKQVGSRLCPQMSRPFAAQTSPAWSHSIEIKTPALGARYIRQIYTSVLYHRPSFQNSA